MGPVPPCCLLLLGSLVLGKGREEEKPQVLLFPGAEHKKSQHFHGVCSGFRLHPVDRRDPHHREQDGPRKELQRCRRGAVIPAYWRGSARGIRRAHGLPLGLLSLYSIGKIRAVYLPSLSKAHSDNLCYF